jgi:hypothetical protein
MWQRFTWWSVLAVCWKSDTLLLNALQTLKDRRQCVIRKAAGLVRSTQWHCAEHFNTTYLPRSTAGPFTFRFCRTGYVQSTPWASQRSHCGSTLLQRTCVTVSTDWAMETLQFLPSFPYTSHTTLSGVAISSSGYQWHRERTRRTYGQPIETHRKSRQGRCLSSPELGSLSNGFTSGVWSTTHLSKLRVRGTLVGWWLLRLDDVRLLCPPILGHPHLNGSGLRHSDTPGPGLST